ncbi:MAG: undecaprenyl-diphosphate phosphatase [archaeon]
MTSILISVLLGLVQGISEWLPISSSGHLAIIQNIFKINVGVEFDIALHFGTILAVVVFFWKDIVKIVTKEQKILVYIIVASIPTAIIGFGLSLYINNIFSSFLIIGISFLITGALIFISSLYFERGKLNIRNTFIAGIFQGVAVIPGISRSGATISSLMFQGVERKQAARFSFLLAIPAVIGANLIEIKSIVSLDYFNLIPGLLAAFIGGLVALFLLFNYMIESRWRWFAYYCWFLGLVVLILYFLI